MRDLYKDGWEVKLRVTGISKEDFDLLLKRLEKVTGVVGVRHQFADDGVKERWGEEEFPTGPYR